MFKLGALYRDSALPTPVVIRRQHRGPSTGYKGSVNTTVVGHATSIAGQRTGVPRGRSSAPKSWWYIQVILKAGKLVAWMIAQRKGGPRASGFVFVRRGSMPTKAKAFR